MNIIIYSQDPNVKTIELKVDKRNWKYPIYIDINDENLPRWAFEYSSVKGRIPDFEDIIKKEPYCAYWYARNVIKNRWPEAEEYILRDETATLEYINYLEAMEIITNTKILELLIQNGKEKTCHT